ncbi:hypothetical protein MC378_13820 [Polaribacter sp. MSW13]|uniref:Uncharacterized protein n=1 Tax=Polaribacter marinus TaxID=2916838 RepID=A0A9X1VVA4_9FLAO|nr:hypothetical protein [Polaribacter marinus]MCI2230251.1 hypothetical protein [Polaribacter marinus]
MKRKNLKKMIFISLILMSFVQIIKHYRSIPDFIYGGLIGITIGIIFTSLYKLIKLKNSTLNS